FLLILASCKTSKDYLAHRNEDKTLYDIVKRLNKHSDDELASKALPEVYAQLQQTHLENIEMYKASPNINRWDKIENEYSIMQDMYNAVNNSSASSKLIKAINYQKEIDATRISAAQQYYEAGKNFLTQNNWEDARKAYAAFKKANNWIED